MTVKIIEKAQPIAPKKDWGICLLLEFLVWFDAGRDGSMDRGDERHRRDWLIDCVSCAGGGAME